VDTHCLVRIWLFTGSIAQSANCRYLIYSEADFEAFRPGRGYTLHRWGWNLAWKRGPKVPSSIGPLLHAKFHPIGATTRVYPQKLKFLLRFDQNVEYKRPAGAYPLRDFHKICKVCTTFQDKLGVKIWLDLLEGLWSYGGFNLRGSGFPQIFSAS